MRFLATTALSLLLCTLVGCGADPEPLVGRSAKSAQGLYTVTYAPSPDPIPFAELFELSATVTDASGKAASGATLGIKVTMPSHGHGMQTSPEVTSSGDGKFKIAGMKFHMRGDWQIVFTVDGPAGSDTVAVIESMQ